MYIYALELKKTIECSASLSYLDVQLTEGNIQLQCWINEIVNIVNFPHLNSNIPAKLSVYLPASM